MKHLILLKLGGSLITDKSVPDTFLPETVSNIAHQIKQFLDNNSTTHLIIGTGGGSFPHVPAKKYQIAQGLTHSQSRYGFALTHYKASQINLLCIEQLLPYLNVISVHPSNISLTDASDITVFHTDVIENLLANNFIPVVHGDAIIDLSQGSAITSTETNLVYLAKHFNNLNHYQSIRIIQATDVDGVLDAKGQIIPEITHSNFDEIKGHLYRNTHADVTGGILHKLESALQLTTLGIHTTILNGNTPNLIGSSLKNEPTSGTTIS